MPYPKRHLAPLLAVALWIGTAGASEPGDAKRDRSLSEAVAAITRADHRGDRAELERLAESLAANGPNERRPWLDYWSGFAWWRRGMNGYNETPNPPDLLADFERGAARERAALARDARFEEARIALFGCLWGEMSLSAKLPLERREALLAEWAAVRKALEEKADGNPRALWMVGGLQSFGKGADPEKAALTYLRGLAAARAESRSAAPREPWTPSWGAPELLMSLAYLHTLGPMRDPRVARAYAEGALAAAPDWRWVRDTLVPQIEKMSEAAVEGKASPASASGTGTEHDFDFLQGTWEIAYSSKMYGDTVGRWTGTKQGDGQVLVDEFRLFGPADSPVALGMTYRVFDPRKKRWAIRYVDVVNGSAWHEGEAWRDGADIRLDQRSPEGAILRVRYYEIGSESFRWRADRSTDGGATWLADAIKIEARRAHAR